MTLSDYPVYQDGVKIEKVVAPHRTVLCRVRVNGILNWQTGSRSVPFVQTIALVQVLGSRLCLATARCSAVAYTGGLRIASAMRSRTNASGEVNDG
jgi:hypothetical protein